MASCFLKMFPDTLKNRNYSEFPSHLQISARAIYAELLSIILVRVHGFPQEGSELRVKALYIMSPENTRVSVCCHLQICEFHKSESW